MASQNENLQKLAAELVTPERFAPTKLEQVLGAFAVEVIPDNVLSLFPDMPQAAIHYFPDRSGQPGDYQV